MDILIWWLFWVLMSSDERKQNFFTLPVSYMMEQLQQTDEQILGSELILHHFLDSQAQKDRFLIPMIVDILWLNYGIIRLLTPHIEDPVFVNNPDTGETEYMIDDSLLTSLQALVLSRHRANKDLSRLSCSIIMH